MVVRTYRDWNPRTLLMKMEHGTGTVENNLVIPQKVNHRELPCDSAILPKYIPQRIENGDSNKYCTQMFIAALSTIARTSHIV